MNLNKENTNQIIKIVVIAIINKYYQNKNKNQIQEKIKARVKELINK